MKGRKLRHKKIPLPQIPKHVVIAWLRKAVRAGTLEDAARSVPRPRAEVASAVSHAVRTSMRGQDEALIERAILGARRDADCLFRLVVNLNTEVIENELPRNRECLFLSGYVRAESNWKITKSRVERLHSTLLVFLESMVIFNAAIANVSSQYLNGHPALFPECRAQLEYQLQIAKTLTKHFNELAAEVDLPPINLTDLPKGLQADIERQVSSWINLAIVEMLDRFGDPDDVCSAMDRFFLATPRRPGTSTSLSE